MLVKMIIILFLLVIMYSLGSALYYLTHERNDADASRVIKALTWRIGLSLLLFIFIIRSLRFRLDSAAWYLKQAHRILNGL